MSRKKEDKNFTNHYFKPFTAKNSKQKELFNTLNSHHIVFIRGPAGTGKTAIPTSYAAEQLYNKKISRIIVTRPAVEAAGERLGFLPGTLDEKFLPYIEPLRDIFEQVLGKSHFENYLKDEKIKPVPLAYMKGRTFKDCVIIADEMQDSNPKQMEMLCTRIGENSKLFCTGDEEQTDIHGSNGLEVACKYLEWMAECKIVNFGLEDIVRSRMTDKIVMSFRKYKNVKL